MTHVKHRCSRCGALHSRTHRYCADCHATYMRDWRKTHPPTVEQRRKDNCRSYAGVYLRRGKLVRQPCEECGSADAQMHHPDYAKPLLVKWLCRACHLHLHRGEEAALTMEGRR